MECGPDLLDVVETNGDLQVKLERSKIKSHAVPALSKFLLHLQVYKSTANAVDGAALLSRYSDVDERFSNYHPIVLRKKPRRIQYVQPNTYEENGQVYLREYPATREGLIQSWAERAI